MSRVLEDDDVAAITVLLSPDRLAVLKALTGSARIAIELHQETLRLGAALMNVLATVELALRNSVCENLAAYFGTTAWLTQPPAPFQWKEIENEAAKRARESAHRSEYAKMSQEQKTGLDAKAFPNGRQATLTHRRRAQQRYRQIPVTDGKVIAETTFHFWKRLYSGHYDQTLWRTTLKQTFPNKKIKRANVADTLERIYQARNRLAHHEPVLHKRFHDTISAIIFLSENMGTASPSTDTPLAKLIEADLKHVKENAQRLHDRLSSFRNPD